MVNTYGQKRFPYTSIYYTATWTLWGCWPVSTGTRLKIASASAVSLARPALHTVQASLRIPLKIRNPLVVIRILGCSNQQLKTSLEAPITIASCSLTYSNQQLRTILEAPIAVGCQIHRNHTPSIRPPCCDPDRAQRHLDRLSEIRLASKMRVSQN